MLASLSIRNVLLIRQLDLEFGDGLNVFTGETGAGKSILLDSLGYVLGARGLPALEAADAEGSSVSAIFLAPGGHPARAVLQRSGLPDAGEILLRRTLSRSGRSACFVNDSRCTAETLRALAAVLVEVHGQNADRSQMHPAGHRAMLDNYAGAGDLVRQVRGKWRALQDALKARDDAAARHDETVREAEFLQHALNELRSLNPEDGEEEMLSVRRSLLKNHLRYQEELARALEAVGMSGAEGSAAEAIRWLQTAAEAEDPQITEAAESIDRAMLELNEAVRTLEQICSRFDQDPLEIERVEDRLHRIRRLAKKHNVQPDQLHALPREFEDKLAALRHGLNDPVVLAKRAKDLRGEYDRLAEQLSAARVNAARRLDRAVDGELAPLKLRHARFSTALETRQPGADGIDTVCFTATTNPSTPAGPINRIASGGEFSRFMLALKVCLTAKNSGVSMIFDEIDRGVGGAAADAVGRRLHSLGKRSQVLVVTHSPQVAAYGNRHWRIEKTAGADDAQTRAVRLEGRERATEIARMLAGKKITGEAQAAAVSLLDSV